MAADLGSPVSLITVGGAAFCAGLWLMRRGWRGRRVGDAPACAACGYSLIARTSDRCSECGTDVTGAGRVVFGERVRGRAALGVGFAMAAVAVLYLGAAASDRIRKFDWYTLKPTAYVLSDLRSRDTQTRVIAWMELKRREREDGPLGQLHHDRLAEIALGQQASAGAGLPRTELVNWLTGELVAGRLKEEHARRFFEQVVKVSLAVRPTVIEGDPAPYRVTYEAHWPGGGFWSTMVEDLSVSVDGGTPEPRQRAIASSETGEWPSRGGGGVGHRRPSSTVRVTGHGRHRLTVLVRVRVWEGFGDFETSGPGNTLRHSREVQLTGTFDVVADGPQHRVRRLVNPEHAARIRAAIKPIGFMFGFSDRGELSGELLVSDLPVTVAFDASARIAGKEYPLGMTAMNPGVSLRTLRGPYDGPADITAFDLILRPSEAAARRSVEDAAIWDGVLEYKDVPVTVGR